MESFKILILRAIKNTKNTMQKKSSLFNLPSITAKLEQDLKNNQYQPQRLSCFAVTEPTIREIFAPHYQDRIIHHILVDNISPEIDRKFIFDSYANRSGKGTHKAVEKLQSFLRKNQANFYLQADIKTFFPSIDKTILIELVTKHILQLKTFNNTDKEFFLNLAKTIINQNIISPLPIFTGDTSLLKQIPPHKSLFNMPANKGLPIGSLSSQFFANLYLNELDQFVKHKLKVKYYLRYVDDFVIIAENPQILNYYLQQIAVFLNQTLKLTLNPKKTILQPCSHGINFLGYIVRKNYFLVRNRTIKSFKRYLYFINHLINPIKFPIINLPHNSLLVKSFRNKEIIAPITLNAIILKKILATINSYYGIFCFANSFNLRVSLYVNHFHALKEHFLPQDKKFDSLKIKNLKNIAI